MHKTLEISWRDIPITLKYCPDYSQSYRSIYGHSLSHIEIHCAEELPVTQTGYRSIFISAVVVQDMGGFEAFAMAYIEEGALEKNWRRSEHQPEQLKLF